MTIRQLLSRSLSNSAITAEKIAASAITSDKIANGTISIEKLDAQAQANITQGAAPKITTVVYPTDDLAVSDSGGETVTLEGSNFQSGAAIYIGTKVAPSVTYTNSSSISFTTPALPSGDYLIYVINPDGSTGIAVPGLSISGFPNWTTAAGALTNATEAAYTVTLNAVADSNITYSVFSGALPEGLSLNANTGVISGTLASNVANLSSNTSYNFSISASDQELQNTERSFSILYVPTFPTWYSPNAGSLGTIEKNIPYTANLNAISNSNVTYTIPSGNLVANIAISGSTLTGTPPDANTYAFTIRATDAEGHFTDRAFTLVVSSGTRGLVGNGSLRTDPLLSSLRGAWPLSASKTNQDVSGKGIIGNFSVAGTLTYSSAPTPSLIPYTTAPTGFTNANYYTSGYDMKSGEITVEGWFYINTSAGSISQTNEFTIVNWYSGQSEGGIKILTTTGVISASAYLGFNCASSSSTVSKGQWYHFAYTRNSSNVHVVYLNGTNVAQVTSSSLGGGYGTNQYGFSQYGGGGQSWSDGYLQDIRIYNSVKYTTNFNVNDVLPILDA